MIIAISVYSFIISWVEMDFLKLGSDSRLKNISIMHSMLTFVIATLLVFRTNTAYERWWEGRKLWGALVNNSRNLALKVNAHFGKGKSREKDFFAIMIPNYAFALRNHLQNNLNTADLEEAPDFSVASLQPDLHNPNAIASAMYQRVAELNRQGSLTGEQMLFWNNELMSFTDICGACERIRNTPIPYSYSVFLKKFIFFFVMTLPLTLVFSLGYYCIPVVAFIFYVLTSMELIAEEIEDPFGNDANDLPTYSICKNIRKHVVEIMER